MNTEKLEKLKKSLDNKFIPDNMKDKIRAEIKKLEADIKTDETITATEVKEEVKEIEKMVVMALVVAEEKEEQAEAKAEEKKEKAPRKAREKKATQSETKTPKVEPKSTAKKKSVFSIAKEIRKDNESWEDAKERARKMMKSETTETKKKTRTETDKLLAMVRRNKEYKKLAGTSNLPKDASRRALPRGKRVSQGGWKNQYGESEGGKVYYENRANRVDVGGFKNAYLENGGGVDGIIELKPLELIPLSTQLNRLSGYNWTSGDWESEDGGKPSTMPNSVIVNVHTKQKFRLSPFYVYKGIDHYNSKPLYRVEDMSEEGEYVGEWYTNREDAVQELKEMFGSYADKGVYVETLDEEIDLTDDGIVKATKTQQGGNKSFGERREMHGASPEALAFDNGGSIEDEKFKKFINSQVSYIISLKTISQKREPIQNLLDNMEDYRSGSEIVKRITTDNLKYALQQKTVSKMNEVLRISLNALQYANGGRTRERRYVNHSQDYEVRYSKDKPHRRGYGYAEGGTIIGTPETPLARGLDIDYTGLVGETGGMSAGEMFAEGGSIGQMVNFEDWQLYDRDTDLERMKKSCNAIRKNGFKAIVVEDKGMYYVLYKSMSDSEGKRVYAEGGSIENQYEGKTPSQIWSMLSISQKYHFLEDHSKEIESTPMSIEKATKTAYKFLPTKIKKSFEHHVEMGQYAMGGSLGNHGLKQGDEIIKTMSGGVQKVKTKSGDIVYVNLANGYRGVTPPLPFAKGGYTNERRHVNKAQDYEVRYAKPRPNRTGYSGKRSFDDGGEISSKQLDLGYQYSFEKDEDNVGSLYKEAGVYSVIGFENGKHFSESFEKFSDAKKFYLDKKGKVKFDDGGFMTDPTFGDFQSGVYATGGGVDWRKYPFKKVLGLYEIKGSEINRKVNIVFFEKYSDDLYLLTPLDRDRDIFKGIFVKSTVLNSLDKGVSVKGETNDGKKVSIKRIGNQDFSYEEGGGVGEKYLVDGDRVLNTETNMYVDYDFETKERAEYFAKIKNDRIKEHGVDFATGGLTKNYINRNQLNTITIKKGDKKLTYKVSDVYNGAYKLEDGGNLERTAFYVSKRNVVKVQLKDGKDVKVANGYWIKKGAKPIHTSKYDDGGNLDGVNPYQNINSIRERYELLNDMYSNEESNVDYTDILKVGDVVYGDDIQGFARIVKEVNDSIKGDYFILQDRFNEKFAFYIVQLVRDLHSKEIFLQNVSISEKDFLYSEDLINLNSKINFLKGRIRLYEKNPNDASNYHGINYQNYISSKNDLKKLEEDFRLMLKDERRKFEDGGQLEMKFLKGGKLESKIQKKVDEVNSLIEKAIDKDGDPIMVVDKSGTWEEPMQYKPIVYKNGRLYFEYYEPYSGKTKKEVVNKSNIEFDGYPMLLDIAKMYRSALKQKGVSFGGGGDTKMVDGVMYEKVKFSNGVEDYYYSSDLHKVNFYCNEHGLNPKNKKDFEKAFSELKKQNKISYKGGGKTTFKEKATAIAKNFEGKKVEPKYQKEYGKTYDKAEAKEVGNKIAGSQKAKYDNKMSGGGKTKRGGAMQLAKQIRKDGESWQSALKRANEQMRKK